MRKHCRQFNASVEASGPHDFTVRLTRARQSRLRRPSLPASHVRDDRETPLKQRRDDSLLLLRLPQRQAQFLKFRNIGLKIGHFIGQRFTVPQYSALDNYFRASVVVG